MTKICKEDGCFNEAAPGRSRCFSDYGKKRRRDEKAIRPKAPDGSLKLLMLDIETFPNKVYTWGIWQQNIGINQIIAPGGLLCFSAKWWGQDEIEFYSQWDDGDRRMALEAHRLLDEADAVVHYYGSRFDIPHLNTHFLKEGLPPPSPFKQIDLKMAVGKQFKFTSNKLQFVSQVLGLEGKEDHEGFPLWDKVLNETGKYSLEVQQDARERMTSYNKRDVFLLDEVYEALLPWIPNHPHRHLYQEGTNYCPTCGEGPVLEDGYSYTKLSKFKRFRCQACNCWLRSSKREMGVSIQESVL